MLDYILSHESGEYKRVGNGYRMKDDDSVAVSEKGFYLHKEEKGGKTALDYLTTVRGYGLVDAVCMLLHEKPIERPEPSKPKPPPERKLFALPVRNNDNKRVIAYLQSRGISKDIILDCIDRGSLYESKNYHNAVFVGRDERGKARYAAMRGTLGSFKLDTEGSNKKYGFILPPNNPNSHEVAVYEGAINTLSHKTLCEQGLIPPFDGWRLTLGCGSVGALEHFLKQNPHITHCIICTDNDKVGDKTAVKISEMQGITSARDPPPYGNDWNDTLQAVQKAQRTQNRARQSHSPR